MRTLLRFTIVGAICALATQWSVGQEEATELPKIVLPQYRLLDLGVTTRWEADKLGFITQVTVTDVLKRSAAYAQGLCEGDTLLAINHRQVVGMRRNDYLAFLEAPLTPGKPRIYTFSMTRGSAIITTTTFDLVVDVTQGKKPTPSPTKNPAP